MPIHTETRDCPYSAKQMYDLVADVMKYPEFIPWCEAMRQKSDNRDEQGAGELVAEMIVKYKFFRNASKAVSFSIHQRTLLRQNISMDRSKNSTITGILKTKLKAVRSSIFG